MLADKKERDRLVRNYAYLVVIKNSYSYLFFILFFFE